MNYFYSKSLIDGEYKFEWKHLIHLLPTVICFLLILPYYLLPGDYKYEQFESFDIATRDKSADFKIWFHLAFFIQGILYVTHTLRALKNIQLNKDGRVKRRILEAVKWIKRFTLVFLIFICTYIATYSYITYRDAYLFEIFRLFNLFTSVFIYIVVYWFIRKSELLLVPKMGLKPKIENLDLRQQIENLIVQEQRYRDPEFNLYMLSKSLDINTQYLSSYINNTFDCSFTHLVNAIGSN